MAIIKCSECKKKISSQATICPHCGCPVNADEKLKHPKEKKKVSWKMCLILSILLVISVTTTVLLVQNKSNLKHIDQAIVKIVCYDPLDNIISTGSGFFYRDSTHIVTNHHVIENAYKITYITSDDITHNIDYIYYYSNEMDIAILSTEDSNNYRYLTARSKNVEKGEKIYAIGSPLGIQNTLSEGIISGNHMINGINAIQFTAPISSGSSGGALIDSKGQVVGITFASYENGQNINLAIPIELLEKACPKWNNSMVLKPGDFYKEKYSYAKDLDTIKSIYNNLEVVTLDDIKKSNDYYYGKPIAFNAYISSSYGGNSETPTLFYQLSNKEDITGDYESDIINIMEKGVRQTPFIIARAYTTKKDHVEQLPVGANVWIICVNTDDKLDAFTLIMMYDEENDKYISIAPSLVEALKNKE